MKIKVRHTAGFSLVEVTLALAVTAFCLVVIFGLLPVGLNSNQNSIQQTAAANIARAIISDLRATQISIPASTRSTMFRIPIPPPGVGSAFRTLFLREDGSTGTTRIGSNADPTQNPRYRATIYFTPPAAGQRTATTLRILITWPAMADRIATSQPGAYTGSYEISTTLDRN
ncbi:MAG: hypothetical protein WCD79_05080 [Chthoniobacteraceae bacterium]